MVNVTPPFCDLGLAGVHFFGDAQRWDKRGLTRLAQSSIFLRRISWHNVYAGELQVRPPPSPIILRDFSRPFREHGPEGL